LRKGEKEDRLTKKVPTNRQKRRHQEPSRKNVFLN